MLVVFPVYFRTPLQLSYITLLLSDLTMPKCLHTSNLNADLARSVSGSAFIVYVSSDRFYQQ